MDDIFSVKCLKGDGKMYQKLHKKVTEVLKPLGGEREEDKHE